MMGTTLAFEITLSADYHVGAGHGDGLVDSVLLRDGDGVPVLRGSALAGLIREAMRGLLAAGPFARSRQCRWSDGPPGTLHCPQEKAPCPVCRVFGTPARAKQWAVRSARPVDALMAWHDTRGDRTDSQVVRRVAVNPRTRRADPHKLFAQEHGDRSLVFSFTVESDADDEAALDEAALIVAAARALRGFGRARRRGFGAGRVHLADRAEEARWLARFRSRWIEGAGSDHVDVFTGERRAPAQPRLRRTDVPGRDRVRVRVYARADEPILLAERAEAGNEFETRAFIPGTAVLGALAGRVVSRLQRHQLAEPGVKAAFVETFLRGRIRFGPLFPAVYDHARLVPAVPAPLDLLTCKTFPGFDEARGEHGVRGYALKGDIPRECPECVRRAYAPPSALQGVDGFVAVGGVRKEVTSRRRHEMHIAIDPQTGRVGEGSLYGYVTLAAGQFFVGEIAGEARDVDALWAMADLPAAGDVIVPPLCVGKATRRGHGQLTVVFDRLAPGAADPWRPVPLEQRVRGRDAGTELTLTLLTDAIVIDPWLRARMGFEEAWLSTLLGAEVEIVQAFARSRVVDGFFGHLGIPRFRDVALVAGSTVGLRLKKEAPADLFVTLVRLEHEGIGLRREEGFGQVIFNHVLAGDGPSLDDNRLPLPAALAARHQESAPEVSAVVRRRWEGIVASDSGLDCRNRVGADAIARLLRLRAAEPVESVAALRDARTRVDAALDTFGAVSGGPADGPRGPRKDKAVVRETADCRKRLRELLAQLELDEQVRARPRLFQIAMESLADRVAQGASRSSLQRRGDGS